MKRLRSSLVLQGGWAKDRLKDLHKSLLLMLAGPVFLLAAAALMPGRAFALGRGAYSMEVLVDGVPLQEYDARAMSYVLALNGREYSVRLQNHTGDRVAIALSVDGLNSIDAKTTSALEASKWILGPYETITIGGWQTSSSTSRRFFFTTERKSYGAWLGSTKNLGVIAAAVFRERRPLPPPICRKDFRSDPFPGPESGAEAETGSRGGRVGPSNEDASRDAPSSADAQAKRAEQKSRRALSDELAATGIGREGEHRVQRVAFDAEPSPAILLEVRYEYRDALVRLGVLPPWPEEGALARRERAHGFDDTGFAPDPYHSPRR